MSRQQPNTGFGKREGNESVSEHIRNYLITLGLNKMAEPVRLLTKWLSDQPSESVTVVSSERLTAERAAKLLSEVGVESKVIDPKNRLSDAAAHLLTIPRLCERLEDLPLITEVVIAENLKNYSREIEGIHPSHIPVLYFLCHKYKSNAGLHTPLLTEDRYAGFLRKALDENLFNKTANEMVPYSFQDGESGDTKDALRPFALLEDKRIEFYLNDLPNASQYGIEDRKIAASLIEPDDPDPISGIRPPHPG